MLRPGRGGIRRAATSEGSWRPRGARVNKPFFPVPPSLLRLRPGLHPILLWQTTAPAGGSLPACPRIRRALEPSRDRAGKYTRTRPAACARLRLCVLPFCPCMPPIYTAHQPAPAKQVSSNQQKQQQKLDVKSASASARTKLVERRGGSGGHPGRRAGRRVGASQSDPQATGTCCSTAISARAPVPAAAFRASSRRVRYSCFRSGIIGKRSTRIARTDAAAKCTRTGRDHTRCRAACTCVIPAATFLQIGERY